ncbi:N-acetylmuramoyl-L-alanine amidase family protein [Paenibacillus pinistramenti]|uniref:N-acetylmuramoyl-L-alanine amidase family protein n=1 Tax=Paenibacillus pinistramenti TaxID=1768003 RepID=UPI0011093381|nr:N-acetylmuramoyl-L-alanine amidase family protein [Paenibacillus pinistramenti]
MKKFSFLVILFLCVLAFPLTGHAASNATHILLDGNEIELSQDRQVQTVNNSVMIPIRVVVEELGFDVDWDSKTGTVTIKQSDSEIKLLLNSSTATVNGQTVKLNAAAYAQNGTTFVPIRFVSEQMGLGVNWDGTTKTVSLTTQSSGSGSAALPGSNSGSSNSGTSGTVTSPSTPSTTLTSLKGISFTDNQLIMAVDGQVSPVTSTLTNPDRIVIDLPNVQFASDFSSSYPLDSKLNGAIAVTEYPDVSQIRYSLFNSAPSTVRVVIDLNYAKGFKMTNAGDGLVIIDLNQESASTSASASKPSSSSGKKLVVIDAGHGGSDPGAISVTGRKEKDFTLAVVLKVEKLLQNEPNIDYVLTRSGDTYPTLSDRSNLANNLKADVFVSVHGNSGAATATGVETYYTRSGESLKLANIMHKYLVKSSGLPDRKVRQASLHVTRETTMPAVLLECGFLSNKNDEAKMYSSAFQQKVAEGIVAGIKEYLGID